MAYGRRGEFYWLRRGQPRGKEGGDLETAGGGT